MVFLAGNMQWSKSILDNIIWYTLLTGIIFLTAYKSLYSLFQFSIMNIHSRARRNFNKQGSDDIIKPPSR